MAAPPIPADPRPTVVGDTIAGSICTACGHHSARSPGRCERCLSSSVDARFGPGGTVWSATTVHIRVGDRTPPFVLAYIDLDNGPRVLAHVTGEEPAVGATVRVTGSDAGDLVVEASS